jgi:hypothetical protein
MKTEQAWMGFTSLLLMMAMVVTKSKHILQHKLERLK